VNVTLSRRTPLLSRVSRVLTADPAIDSVSYWDGRSDTDVIVAYADDEAANHAPRFVVTVDEHLDCAGLTNCNPKGLAGALARVSGGTVEHLSWAKPGAARGSEAVQFPDPVGLRYGSIINHTLTLTPAGSAVSSIMVDITTDNGPIRYGVVDDAEFLAAVCWAAGVVAAGSVIASGEKLTPTEVADEYLQACQNAGIVIARLEQSP
jgi:hypothetical protein